MTTKGSGFDAEVLMKKSNVQLQLGGLIPETSDKKSLKKNYRNPGNSKKGSNDQYRNIVENLVDGLCIIQDLKIVFCNSRLAQIFGFDNCQELLGTAIKNLIAPANWSQVKTQILAQLDGKQEIVHFQFQGIKKGGTLFNLETVGSKIYYQKQPAVQEIIREITASRASEAVLRMSETSRESGTRNLFESSPDAIYMVDKDGKIMDANLASCLLHNMGRSELLKQNLSELIDPEFKAEAVEVFSRWFSGEVNFYETVFRTDTGMKVPVELRFRKKFYTDQDLLTIFAHDISDRVKVGQSFLESQRALATFMSNLPGMAYRCLNDDQWTMKFISNGCINLTGYLPEDLIENKKLSFADIIHPSFRNYVAEEIRRSLADKKPFQLEFKIITALGAEKWVWEQGRGVFADDGLLIALEGIITDINPLKKTETALRESEKRFRSLIENVPTVALVGYDINHRIFFWNRASEKFFGYQKDEAVGKKLEELIFPEYKRTELHAAIESWIKTGIEIPTGEERLLHKEGSVFEFLTSHIMLKNVHDQPEMYCLNIDLTELNRTKKDLQKSLFKLKRALDGTIQALTLAVEMRDPYTSGHQNHVAKLACAIAKELELPEDKIEGLRVASLLHDIGNLNVPAEILNKPGQLTEIEYTLLKTHPQFGFEILRTIHFPWPVAQMVLQHHERLDGSGYPQGLKGNQIMLEARIISVADVVEPISSHRPYRPALGIPKAIEEIENGKGKLFDPLVVETCIKLIKDKGFRFENNF